MSFPLLSDFEPKGAMARSYGVYLDGPGITDRATVIVDASGRVRYAQSVGPGGRRDLEELAAECEKVDRAGTIPLEGWPHPPGFSQRGVLFVKSGCGFSRAALLARDNLHLAGSIDARNISESPEARKTLVEAAGRDQAPCLILGGQPLLESAEIIDRMVQAAAPL